VNRYNALDAAYFKNIWLAFSSLQRISPTTLLVIAANVGDARIVLGRRNQAIRMTRDHNAHDPEEVNRIEQSGGFLVRNRVLGVLAITRSMGDQVLKDYVIAHPYIQQEEMLSESFLIVACDGFWDVFTDQEAVNLVAGYGGEDVAQFLVEQAILRGTCDNLTVIVGFIQ
jgi:serine/threonine protein phosphatase PrpC